MKPNSKGPYKGNHRGGKWSTKKKVAVGAGVAAATGAAVGYKNRERIRDKILRSAWNAMKGGKTQKQY